MDSGIYVAGRVLKVEPRKGTFTDEKDGRQVAYDFTLVKFIAGEDTVVVKFKSDRPAAPVPEKGTDAVILCEFARGQLVAVETAA